MKKIKCPMLFRTAQFSREHINEENRTAELSFSSEEPYERWFGVEILDHGPKSVRLGRLNGSGPLLVDHRTPDHVGVVESVSLENRRGRALVRFGESVRASEIFKDVVDGIRKSVSVGYRVIKMVLEEQSDDGPDIYRVMDWEPLEISLVSVPADATVGVGRQAVEEYEVEIIEPTQKRDIPMKTDPKDTNTPPAPAANQPPPVDVKAIETEARKGELQRIRDITTAGEKMGHPELAKQFVENGKDIAEFREVLLDKMGDAAPLKPMPENAAAIGLNEKEIRQYSILRAIRAQIFKSGTSEHKRAIEDASFELEASRAAAEHMGKDPQGILVPFDILRAQRVLTAGTASGGGDTVATDLLAESFIQKLDNAMALVAAGVTRLNGLVGNVAIPRVTGGATAYWVAENGVPTTSQQTFDQVTLNPTTLGAFTDISRRLILQSSIDVENFVQSDLAMRLAMALDIAGLHGSGSSNQPTGIENVSGIGSVAGGTNGLAPAWSHIVDLESAVANANAAMGSLAYITNTKVRGRLKQTEKFSTTNGNPVWGEGAAPLNGYNAVVSNQVKSDNTKGSGSALSYIFFANWADLILGMWGGLDITADPYTGATAGTVRIVALQDVQYAVRHAESFAMMNDAITV